jgi:DHA1 family tetracycline resistance protein-like MFS transporter
MNTRAGRAPAMPFILITVLIDMVSVGLIIPVLPPLVGQFTSDAVDHAFWYGVVAFAFGIANFFGSPILGRLSDRYGRRPVLLLGFMGLALNFFATAMAQALWVLVAVRAVGGAMQANAAVAHAYVADISAPDERARRFGLVGAMFGVGYVLGPVMGGVLGDIDLHLPFYVAGTLAVLNTFYGWLILPESLPKDKRTPFDWRRANPISSLQGLSALSGVKPLLWVVALSNLAQFILHMTWVLYCSFKFGWGPKENGWSLFVVGVTAAVVQGGLMRWLLKRLSPQQLVQMGLVSSAIGYLAWGLATEGWMMMVIVTINLLGFTVGSSVQSLISNAASDREQGTAMGSVASLTSAMAVAAPVIGAGLLGAVSHLEPSNWLVGLPFFACCALQVVGATIAIRHFSLARKSDQPSAAAASS